MGIRLDDEARRYMATFADHTDITPVDCVPGPDAIIFVVPPDDMAAAIGPNGQTVRQLEDRLDRRVILIEDAERAGDFVAHALAPAAVYDVDVNDGVAVAHVDPADVGVAIGPDGERIDRARDLAHRHFDIEAIEIVSDSTRPANEDA